MPADSLLKAIVPLVDDLGRDLPEQDRYARLLAVMRELLPCDATALLRLEGDTLVPLATSGLSPDTLGRRFRVSDHPRFQTLLAADGPTRFPADSPLPDPYDGLVEGMQGHLPVHDCLGCPVRVDGQLWGLLTLDALAAGQLESITLAALDAFTALAAATVKVAERLNELTMRLDAAHRQNDAYRRDRLRATPRLIGQSPAHLALMDEIALVAGSDLTVLVSGETGTGKELVAEAIHAASARAEQPLITVNCAALPETLVESELFGHVRGAFSGAVSDRRGRFELAHGGTLFLDEVGELPLPVQAKLLRALQSGQLQRLGSDREHRVDVRLIAATNRDLAEAVRNGTFRADLYHRLSVYPLRVPTLRERGRDVLLLAGAFLEAQRLRLRVDTIRLAGNAQAALLAYDWPGNVRELEHLMGRAALKALGRQRQRPRILSIEAIDLDLGMAPPAMPAQEVDATIDQPLRDAVDDFQRRLIAAQRDRHDGNWAAVARSLALDPANLARLARRLGLR